MTSVVRRSRSSPVTGPGPRGRSTWTPPTSRKGCTYRKVTKRAWTSLGFFLYLFDVQVGRSSSFDGREPQTLCHTGRPVVPPLSRPRTVPSGDPQRRTRISARPETSVCRTSCPCPRVRRAGSGLSEIKVSEGVPDIGSQPPWSSVCLKRGVEVRSQSCTGLPERSSLTTLQYKTPHMSCRIHRASVVPGSTSETS